MEDIKTLLDDEIREEIEGLKNIELGSEPYKTTVDGLTKLVDKALEIQKLESESQLKLDSVNEDKKDRLIKNGIAIGGIVIPTVVTIWGTIKSLKFEEEGSVTTIVGRGFINKLLPKK